MFRHVLRYQWLSDCLQRINTPRQLIYSPYHLVLSRDAGKLQPIFTRGVVQRNTTTHHQRAQILRLSLLISERKLVLRRKNHAVAIACLDTIHSAKKSIRGFTTWKTKVCTVDGVKRTLLLDAGVLYGPASPVFPTERIK